MARYFFHLYNDEVTIDDEGKELPDDGAACELAKHEALVMAAESIKAHAHLVLSHRIEVTDVRGKAIAAVSFGDIIAIKE